MLPGAWCCILVPIVVDGFSSDGSWATGRASLFKGLCLRQSADFMTVEESQPSLLCMLGA